MIMGSIISTLPRAAPEASLAPATVDECEMIWAITSTYNNTWAYTLQVESFVKGLSEFFNAHQFIITNFYINVCTESKFGMAPNLVRVLLLKLIRLFGAVEFQRCPEFVFGANDLLKCSLFLSDRNRTRRSRNHAVQRMLLDLHETLRRWSPTSPVDTHNSSTSNCSAGAVRGELD